MKNYYPLFSHQQVLKQLCSCVLWVVILLVHGIGCSPSDNLCRTSAQLPSRNLQLDIVNPNSFVRREFGSEFTEKPIGYESDVASIENGGSIEYKSGIQSVESSWELIVVSSRIDIIPTNEKPSGSGNWLISIDINSKPMTLDHCGDTALQLAELIGMDGQELKKNIELVESGGAVRSFSEIFRHDGTEYVIDIRKSYNTNLPWRFIFCVSFDRDERNHDLPNQPLDTEP